MLKITISAETIEWLCNELDCGAGWAEEFAQNFISFLQATGGISTAAPDRTSAVSKDWPYTCPPCSHCDGTGIEPCGR